MAAQNLGQLLEERMRPTSTELDKNPNVLLTGSRAFCTASDDSDEDWLMGMEAFYALGLSWDDLELMGEYIGTPFVIYRDKELNRDYIIYTSELARANWLLAHDYCLVAQPRSRDERIRIFKWFLYSEGDGHGLATLKAVFYETMKQVEESRELLHGTAY